MSIKSPHLPHYGILIGTTSDSASTPPESWQTRVLNWISRSILKWGRHWDQSSPPTWSNSSETVIKNISWQPDPGKISEIIHTLLDVLPGYGPCGYYLDLVWIINGVKPEKIMTPLLYGALRRSLEWHNSSLVLVVDRDSYDCWKSFEVMTGELNALIVCLPGTEETTNFPLLELRVWRGQVELLSNPEIGLETLSGQFELVGKDFASYSRWLPSETEDKDNLLVSRCLTIMSKCSLSTVPKYLFTDIRFTLKPFISPDELHSLTHKVLNTDALFSENHGVIARLSYCRSSYSFSKPKIGLADWKKYVINANQDDRSTCGFKSVANSELYQDYLYMLVFRDSEGSLLAIVLDHTRSGILKSYEVSQSSVYHKFSAKHRDVEDDVALRQYRLSTPANLSKIQATISQIQSEVLKMLVKSDPDSSLLKGGEIESTLKAIQARVLSRMHNVLMEQSDVKADVNDDDIIDAENKMEEFDFDWEEKRFLAYVEKIRESAQKSTSLEATMKPSTDFIILDAREILALFNSEGLPKWPEKQQAFSRKTGKRIFVINEDLGGDIEHRLKTNLIWPEVSCLKYHDLYYNICEDSEDLDVERTRLQRMYLGVNETGSTCNMNELNKPVIVRKKNENNDPETGQAHTDEVKETASQPLRRSPRKKSLSSNIQPRLVRSASYAASMKSGTSSRTGVSQSTNRNSGSKSGDELYRKKLRNAVYEALTRQNIDEKHALFRPCFKRLFEITKIYAKDTPRGVSLSTSQWLQNVAEQNSQTVINLEKSIHSQGIK